MKLTPEQKAFYECGKSVESVRETIQKIRQITCWQDCKRPIIPVRFCWVI